MIIYRLKPQNGKQPKKSTKMVQFLLHIKWTRISDKCSENLVWSEIKKRKRKEMISLELRVARVFIKWQLLYHGFDLFHKSCGKL